MSDELADQEQTEDNFYDQNQEGDDDVILDKSGKRKVVPSLE
jgi:hypothetical protein